MNIDERFMRYWTRAQPVVAGYVSSMTPDVHEADDLLQDTAVVLLRKFGEYDPGRSFVAWALGIAKSGDPPPRGGSMRGASSRTAGTSWTP